MTVSTQHRSSVLVTATHLAQIAILVAMPLPHLWKVPAQFDSGYVPPYYPLFITMLVVPLLLAALTLPALVAARRGIHGWLIAVDLATAIAAWTFLIIYVFSSDLPDVLIYLAPVNLIAAIAVARRSRTRLLPGS